MRTKVTMMIIPLLLVASQTSFAGKNAFLKGLAADVLSTAVDELDGNSSVNFLSIPRENVA